MAPHVVGAESAAMKRAARGGMSVAAVARAFGRSRTTVHRAIREHREKARKVVKPRAEVVRRRRVVVSLAEKVTTRNGRTYPKFGSSRRIARELRLRDGQKPRRTNCLP
jgi:transposase-like protein